MRKLLNTLYITNEEAYLSLDGENIVIENKGMTMGRIPLHNLEGIVVFSYIGASPALMGKCAEMNIGLSFLKPSGRFLAKITGKAYGNILLRREQYRVADSNNVDIAKSFIYGKLYNCRKVMERAIRDYEMRLDVERLRKISASIASTMKKVKDSKELCQVRGYEGEAASCYFSVFDDLILQQKDEMKFTGRNRRPPTDPVNALLSLTYSLLTSMCCSALETVGLDPYAGFLHTDRPGRASLALDLMEELRPVMCDRFALTLINKKVVSSKDFQRKESGAMLLDDDARKEVLRQWQLRKSDEIMHPFIGDKISWGLIPYVQAMLLARHLRGDLDMYPAFFWR